VCVCVCVCVCVRVCSCVCVCWWVWVVWVCNGFRVLAMWCGMVCEDGVVWDWMGWGVHDLQHGAAER
jgi:hypothetical protein